MKEFEPAQKLLDELRQSPQFREYVDKHQLKLIYTRLEIYDDLLDKGVLK